MIRRCGPIMPRRIIQKDLAACQEAGDKEADRRVMASGILFLTYPVSLPIEQRIQTRKCMEGKGYKLED